MIIFCHAILIRFAVHVDRGGKTTQRLLAKCVKRACTGDDSPSGETLQQKNTDMHE